MLTKDDETADDEECLIVVGLHILNGRLQLANSLHGVGQGVIRSGARTIICHFEQFYENLSGKSSKAFNKQSAKIEIIFTTKSIFARKIAHGFVPDHTCCFFSAYHLHCCRSFDSSTPPQHSRTDTEGIKPSTASVTIVLHAGSTIQRSNYARFE